MANELKTFVMIILIVGIYLGSMILEHEASHQEAARHFGYNVSGINLRWGSAYVDVSEYDNRNYSEARELAMYETQGIIDGVSYVLIPMGAFILVLLFEIVMVIRNG